MKDLRKKFMEAAVSMANRSLKKNAGGPFGCVIVKDGKVISRGNNSVTSHNDPTAHAEMVAIRRACKKLKNFHLEGCEIYTSCEPCPMCMGAIYWSRSAKVYYATTRHDAAAAGFDDEFIYNEISVPVDARKIPFEHFPSQDALHVFKLWNQKEDKALY